jgi:hypothetical protein
MSLTVFSLKVDFAAGFVRVLKSFAVCYGLRLTFGQ